MGGIDFQALAFWFEMWGLPGDERRVMADKVLAYVRAIQAVQAEKKNV